MSKFRSWSLRTAAFTAALAAGAIPSVAAEFPAVARNPETAAGETARPHIFTGIVSPLLPPTPAPAVAAPVALPAAIPAAFDPDGIDPGHYVWQPERSPSGPVEIVVSIPQQVAYIYRGGTLIGLTTVSTGRPGHETPTGRFPIIEKQRVHHSNLYNEAPMPFMQRLTMGGIALHAGQIPGHPASHGCVRLPLDFARILFGVTQVGATVHIIDEAPTPASALAVARGGTLAPAASNVVVASADATLPGHGTN
jgi:lipoprotein-anchoring transpeptidase ErfK/SrfK